MVEVKTYTCEQCVKRGWSREGATFKTLEEAEAHAVRYHDNRFLEMYQRQFKKTDRATREMNLNHMLRDRFALGGGG